MTLEDAVSRTEHMRAFQEAHGGRDAAALGVVLAVARAFPKMLEALEAADRLSFECDGVIATRAPSRETYNAAFDAIKSALRAAREALGPATPPQRCTDTLTTWLDVGDQTVERTIICSHVLPCPFHTPRAAREAVKP